MKYLCVCSGGNVRSVTLAFVLKHHGHDALAISAKFNHNKTIKMMSKWADAIYVVSPELESVIPHKLRRKVIHINLGPDIWHHSLHKDLIKKILALLDFKDRVIAKKGDIKLRGIK